MADTRAYGAHYSDGSFWAKVRGALRRAGVEVVGTALKLYYAMKRPDTPTWAKVTIAGALGYFIFPVDVIPDAVPVLGFTDDLAVMLAALGTVSQYVDDHVKRQAGDKLREWGLA
jgi:uncharacterized membrane protein YkvA (DUF1232 family)